MNSKAEFFRLAGSTVYVVKHNLTTLKYNNIS